MYRFAFLFTITSLSVFVENPGSCFFVSINETHRVKHKVYINLLDNSQCFRMLNGTHQVGCQSNRYGNTGVVHMVTNRIGADWIIGNKGSHAPYIAVLTFKAWIDENLVSDLKKTDNVAGMIILFEPKKDFQAGGYSSDDSCPNRGSGYQDSAEYCMHDWNVYGESRWFQDWKFPIFLLENQTEIGLIKNCYEMYNRPVNGAPAGYPLCAVHLRHWMTASVNTPTCRRRSFLFDGLENLGGRSQICHPLSGYNVFSLIPSIEKTEFFQNDSILIIATRMDSFSMFTNVSPGAESASSALIALLAVARALTVDPEKYQQLVNAGAKNKKHVILAVFNGESMDYIGSGRTIFDMKEGVFPFEEKEPKMNLEHVRFFLELNQLALAEKRNFYAHVDSAVYSEKKKVIDDIIQFLNRNKTDWEIRLVRDPSAVPSSSYQRFLRDKPSLPGFVVTDFGKQRFISRFYNGFGDRKEQFGSSSDNDRIEGLAFVAQKALEMAVDWLDQLSVHKFKVDRSTVRELYDCFIGGKTIDCEFYERAYVSDQSNKGTWLIEGTTLADLYSYPQMLTYIGPGSTYGAVHWTANYLLRAFFAKKTNFSLEQCNSEDVDDEIHSYFWMKDLPNKSNDSFCGKSDAIMKEAKSPAFTIEDYDDWESTDYSTWTESVWFATKAIDSHELLVFLKPHPLRGCLIFFFGLSVTVFSVLIISCVINPSEGFIPLESDPEPPEMKMQTKEIVGDAANIEPIT